MKNEIIFEDDAIIVVNKSAGVYVHPSPGHENGALTDILLRHFPAMKNVGSSSRPGVVHRLDCETSGVIVFAKTARAYFKLREYFESHAKIKKTYLAVVHGSMPRASGTIDEPIGKKSWDAHRMAVNGNDARSAITHWKTLSRRGGVSLVEFIIETGRTHQIRVHSSYLGAPIVGDKLYGDSKRDARLKPSRCLLHSTSLSFPHPNTGKIVTFSAYPPNDLLFAVP